MEIDAGISEVFFYSDEWSEIFETINSMVKASEDLIIIRSLSALYFVKIRHISREFSYNFLSMLFVI
jgi:hypothetical protein